MNPTQKPQCCIEAVTVDRSALPVSLVGWHVHVPTKSNPHRYWWVTVQEQRGEIIKVAGNANAGRPWWVYTNTINKKSKP